MTTREHDETRSMREGEDRQRQALDETKHATKTTEFFTFVGLIIALIIAGGAIDDLDAGRVWLYVTILAVGYMVSRGLAKSLRGRTRSDETKDSYKTTEFYVFLLTLLGLVIAGIVSSGEGAGEVDTLDGPRVWLYATILGVGYMVSRGLAKSGAGAMAETNHGGGAPIGERVKAAAEALSGGEGGSPRAGEGQEHGRRGGRDSR
jgi:positive regulator of sigma E activity